MDDTLSDELPSSCNWNLETSNRIVVLFCRSSDAAEAVQPGQSPPSALQAPAREAAQVLLETDLQHFQSIVTAHWHSLCMLEMLCCGSWTCPPPDKLRKACHSSS